MKRRHKSEETPCVYPVHASGCFSVCDRLAGIFPDKGESTATVCADMDQKASGIHHLRGGGQVPGE